MPISDTVFRPSAAVIFAQNPMEAHLGSDCTGASGATGRVLTVSKTITAAVVIVVDGLVVNRSGSNQTSVSGQAITFNDALLDASVIEVY